MTTTKDERLQIRLEPFEKRLLEQAAAAEHLSVSSFVLQAAALRAEEVLVQRSVIHLSPQGAEALTEALARPAAVNERLASALRRPRAFGWID
jgi:uncharacterized protein (DUF1778 family)